MNRKFQSSSRNRLTKTFANTGDKNFAQALIVGNQLFVTTDSLDVSNVTYATASTSIATGNLYTVDLTGTAATLSATATAPTVVFSGAGGIANGQSSSTEKTKLFASAGNDQQKVAVAATSATGNGVDFQNTSKMSRQIWVASR